MFNKLFDSKKEVEATDLEELQISWKSFTSELEKVFLYNPTSYHQDGKALCEEKLKPHLQKVLNIILEEDQFTRTQHTIGECLEFTLKHGIIMELVAYGKANKPDGLFEIVIKFINYILQDV